MRTIKFKGKSIGTGEWLFGNMFQFGIQPPTKVPCICPSVPTWEDALDIYNVDEKTVGQFTGLYDKNGKEIYEGDIVRHPYIDPIFGDLVTSENEEDYPTSEVVFNEGSFVIRFRDTHYYLCEFVRKNVAEVVGNVHDNPELLDK